MPCKGECGSQPHIRGERASNRAKIKLSVSKSMQRTQSSIKTNVCQSVCGGQQGCFSCFLRLLFRFFSSNELSEMIAPSSTYLPFFKIPSKVCNFRENFYSRTQKESKRTYTMRERERD